MPADKGYTTSHNKPKRKPASTQKSPMTSRKRKTKAASTALLG